MMNEQGGLSAMAVEGQESPMMEQGETAQMEQQEPGGITVEDVIKALMAGIDPNELIKNGVPEELVAQAIQLIQQQAQAPQQVEMPAEGGLSAMGMQ